MGENGEKITKLLQLQDGPFKGLFQLTDLARDDLIQTRIEIGKGGENGDPVFKDCLSRMREKLEEIKKITGELEEELK